MDHGVQVLAVVLDLGRPDVAALREGVVGLLDLHQRGRAAEPGDVGALPRPGVAAPGVAVPAIRAMSSSLSAHSARSTM